MKKFSKNEDYFNEIKDELQAYLLGFFLADGSIMEPKNSSKCFGMCLKEKDLYILELFRDQLSPSSKISSHKKAATQNIQYNIKFTAPILAENLELIYGIKPKKTYDLLYEFPFEKIPNELIHHFIRGFFDGDGTINLRKKGFVPQFGFVFTSMNLLEQFIKYIPFNGHRITEAQGKNLKYFQLLYSCGHGKDIDIMNYLYKDATFFLKRKFDIFQENTELTTMLINSGNVERRD